MASDYKRVFIIKDIDKATAAASNSLLKFLESLNDNSYGILLTENINLVIPTIKSRCINLHFTPKSHLTISNELIKRGIEEDKSRAISVLTNNSSEAIEMSNDIILDQIIKQINKKSLCSFEQRDFFIFIQPQEDFSYRNQEANQVASGGQNSSPEFCQFRILREARPAARSLRPLR